VWPYAWVLPPTVAIAALGVNLVTQGFVKTGAFLIGLSSVTLFVVSVKEKLERFERSHAYYHIDGDRATLQFTYLQFMKLPDTVRTALMYDKRIVGWRKAEMERHGIRLVQEFRTRWGLLKYHLRDWFFAFFGE